MALREVNIMKVLPQHPNLVRFYESAVVKERGNDAVLILQEFCGDGTLIDLLTQRDGKLSLQQVLYIFREVC
jgi:serine/threonine protein kinase